MNPDYTTLYRELGLQPGCSLDDFRQAYRRHVATLHPDRIRVPARGSFLTLSDLTVLYDQAMRFHRRYGRLPGTPPMAGMQVPGSSIRGGATDAGSAIRSDEAPPLAQPTGRWLPWLFVAALALLVVGIWQAPLRNPAVEHARIPDRLPSVQMAPSPGKLVLGMDATTVLAIQGEPVHQREDEWYYGPSWVKFEKGRVVDWYSSPLYRLNAETSTPQHDEGD
jgi:hypothetical protein